MRSPPLPSASPFPTEQQPDLFFISQRMTFHVCKVMTQVTGQQAHPRTRSPQSFNRYITDSIKTIEPWLEVPSAKPCADPGLFARGGGGVQRYKYRVQSHARIQEFLPGGGGGGGGGPGPTVRKQLFFFSPQHCDFPGGPDPLFPLWIRT